MMLVTFILNEEAKTQLSSNLWKQAKVFENESPKEIITKEIKHQVENDVLFNSENQLDNHDFDFEKYHQDLMAQANEQADSLKKQAFNQGKKEGYDAGYLEGKAIGDQIANEINLEATQNLKTAKQTVDDYLDDKKDEIIALAVEMAKTIVKHEIDNNPETIQDILKPILQKLSTTDQLLTITTNPAHRDQLVIKLEERKQEIPNLRYLILDDMQMQLGDLKLETSDSLMVFNLEDELNRFLQKLQEVN